MQSHVEFITTVICSEEMAVHYLRDRNLLDDPEEAVVNCEKCGIVMQNKRRLIRGNSVPVLRCQRKGCQAMRSARHGNSFFHYMHLNNKMNCKVSVCQILDVVYFFLCEIPIKYAETITGPSHSTLVDWYNMCREVCTKVIKGKVKCLEPQKNQYR